MTLDVIAVILGIILTGFGYFSGALVQVTRLVALVLAFIAAPTVANVFKVIWLGKSALGSAWMEWGMLVLAGVAVYAVVSLLGYGLSKVMHASSDELSKADRTGGALLGLIKALGVVYLIVCSLLMVEAQLKEADPDDMLRLQDSALLELTRRYPVVVSWGLPDVDKALDTLKALQKRAPDTGKTAKPKAKGAGALAAGSQRAGDATEAKDDAELGALDALLRDPEMVEAIRREDVSTLLGDPRFRELMRDPRFQKMIERGVR